MEKMVRDYAENRFLCQEQIRRVSKKVAKRVLGKGVASIYQQMNPMFADTKFNYSAHFRYSAYFTAPKSSSRKGAQRIDGFVSSRLIGMRCRVGTPASAPLG